MATPTPEDGKPPPLSPTPSPTKVHKQKASLKYRLFADGISSPLGSGSGGSKKVVIQAPEEPEDEEDLLAAKGSFLHYRKKKKKFYYDDIRKGYDNFFHLDVGTKCDSHFKGRKVTYKQKNVEVFYHVVDLDIFEYHKVVFHGYLNAVLQSAWFRFLVLFLVMLSALMIGLGTYDQFGPYQLYFRVIDQVILSVFMFEIVIKWIYDFRLFWKVSWNILDFVIVFVIILTAVFPIGEEGSGTGRALVMVRVIRAFRSLKSISSLSSLTLVTHTVIKSGADVANILLVLIIFMLVMSVMGVILFDSLGIKHFQNALHAWFLLFVCVTGDGWNGVLDEFREQQTYFASLALYLILAVSVGSFVFANLIVAVIVANLELSVKEKREQEMLVDDPLDTKRGYVVNELGIVPTYEVFARNKTPLLAQRPLKIPTFRYLSRRRLEAYIQLIVALEQNMLEAEIIQLDYEKVMGVILSLIMQLNMYSGESIQREMEEGMDVLQELKGLKALSLGAQQQQENKENKDSKEKDKE